ncbi:diguanylate cyclase [Spirochaetia bacterium 38H-sp]|uniref:diguanylate cyclase n=1 Tax=Rarispira pelagica TaxID=3141764 RepID=A0ABU9U904_9SPIR
MDIINPLNKGKEPISPASLALLDAISTGLFLITEFWTVLFWNRRMTEFTGIEELDVRGRDIRDFLPELSNNKYKILMEMLFKEGAPVILSPQLHKKLYKNVKNAKKEITREAFFNTTITLSQIAGTPCAVFTVEDVTDLVKRIQMYKEMKDRAIVEIERRKRTEEQLKNINKKLERTARTDPLTGLGNRREMEERLDAEMGRSSRTGSPFSIIMADIDSFKSFNDNFGHDCGDYVLVKVSQLFKHNLRKQDTISRWGGEEFLILLPDTKKEGALIAAEKLRRKIEEATFLFDGKEHKVTLTFGVAAYDNKANSVYEYIKKADQALLLGKASGKNCVYSL